MGMYGKADKAIKAGKRYLPEHGGGEGQADQSFKKECDINHLMSKYLKTGTLAHQTLAEPQYRYCQSTTFKEAMDTVAEATTAFESLDSDERQKHNFDVASYLDWLENQEHDDLVEQGLAAPETPAEPDISSRQEGAESSGEAPPAQ